MSEETALTPLETRAVDFYGELYWRYQEALDWLRAWWVEAGGRNERT